MLIADALACFEAAGAGSDETAELVELEAWLADSGRQISLDTVGHLDDRDLVETEAHEALAPAALDELLGVGPAGFREVTAKFGRCRR